MASADIRDGLSYDDVMLVPKRSPVDSRSEVDLTTTLAPGLELSVPITSAAMDTVTETDLAIALSEQGGLGVLHRFLAVDEQARQVRDVTDVGERVGAAVGINEDHFERATALVEAGVDALVIDVAHGHMERCLAVVEELAETFPETALVAGNVATAAGTRDLARAGADCVKVGVGPGSHCTTREKTGAGVPQLTAVMDAAAVADDLGVSLIADGGIRTSGEIVKALMAGADAVMLGGLLSGTTEAPGAVVERDGGTYKVSRGMASKEADAERTDKESLELTHAEGVAGLTPHRGSVAEVVAELESGVRSGISYCGAATVSGARANAEFVRVSDGAKSREGVHAGVVERGD
ncbi:MAG: guanosine monophosphate reductase [Haloferacaceae archaeon]